jgi:hypothetical protein
VACVRADGAGSGPAGASAEQSWMLDQVAAASIARRSILHLVPPSTTRAATSACAMPAALSVEVRDGAQQRAAGQAEADAVRLHPRVELGGRQAGDVAVAGRCSLLGPPFRGRVIQ